MDKAIRDFPKQFEYNPVIENAQSLAYAKHIIAVGMGGSHLAMDIIRMAHPELDIWVHTDYGLPPVSDVFLRESLVICISHSGNTEETLDAFDTAEKKGLVLAVVAAGGALLERAQKKGVAYIQIPNTGIQPRSALGFHVRAILKLLGKENLFQEVGMLAQTLDVAHSEKEGTAIAGALKGKVPIIYSSYANEAIAKNWKIKFNETGKMPAFYNVFPELNHNEMASFDANGGARDAARAFHFIFLKDAADHPRIQRRMEVSKALYEKQGLGVIEHELQGNSRWEKIFSSLLTADFAAWALAIDAGVEPEDVPLIEDFKKMIRE